MRSILAAIAAMALGGATAAAEIDDVNAAFQAAYATACDLFLEDGSPAYEPDVFPVSYRTIWQDESTEPLAMTIYQYRCLIGAYNVLSVFFMATHDEGIVPLQLAQPTYDITYEDSSEGAQVKDIVLTGMTTFPRPTNVTVEPGTGTITATSFWRGIGDASSSGVWKLVNGYYTLVSFDIDGSYDGEVNPRRVWDTEEAAAAWMEKE